MKSFEPCKSSFEQLKQQHLVNSSSTANLHTCRPIQKLIFQKSWITISSQQYEKERAHYEWRMKTEFPVVKIFKWKVMRNFGSSMELQIENEVYVSRLMEMKEVPLFQIIYLLKQSLIGFERLYNRFGSFLVTPRMIAVNQMHKCKVWISQNFASNQLKTFQIDQKYFLNSIFKMFESRCSKSKNSLIFFEEIVKCSKFCTALGFVQVFARSNKLSIPTVYKQIESDKNERPSIEMKIGGFDPSMTMSKTPKFLSENRNLGGTMAKSKGNSITQMINKQLQKETGGMTVSIEFHEQPKMKKSKDTSADIYTSNTLSPTDSKSNIGEKQQVEDKILAAQKEEAATIFKSELQKKPEKKIHSFKRKFSNTTDNYGYCSTPQPTKVNFFQMSSFLNPRKFLDLEEEEDEEETEAKIGECFEKNKWEKTIDGLFKDNSELKKSFHQGKEKKRQSNYPNLELLEKIGKTVYESMMEDEGSFEI